MRVRRHHVAQRGRDALLPASLDGTASGLTLTRRQPADMAAVPGRRAATRLTPGSGHSCGGTDVPVGEGTGGQQVAQGE
jgi:hypothetical protein